MSLCSSKYHYCTFCVIPGHSTYRALPRSVLCSLSFVLVCCLFFFSSLALLSPTQPAHHTTHKQQDTGDDTNHNNKASNMKQTNTSVFIEATSAEISASSTSISLDSAPSANPKKVPNYAFNKVSKRKYDST